MGAGPSKAPEGFDQMKFDQSKEFEATVEYCGSWGYGKYMNYAKQLITAAYPKATVTGARIPGATGCLEVIVDGKKCHSKDNGDGYLSEDNSLAMMRKIQAIVEGAKPTISV